jgi:hypothetical protein
MLDLGDLDGDRQRELAVATMLNGRLDLVYFSFADAFAAGSATPPSSGRRTK